MKQINNTQVIQETGIGHDRLYRWKKEYPRVVELVKKGLAAEKVLKDEIFEDMIKKENKR